MAINIDTHLSIITLNVSRLNVPVKDRVTDWIKKLDSS